MGALSKIITNAYHYFFGNDWKGWLEDEVKEHANTINSLQSSTDCKPVTTDKNKKNNRIYNK